MEIEVSSSAAAVPSPVHKLDENELEACIQLVAMNGDDDDDEQESSSSSSSNSASSSSSSASSSSSSASTRAPYSQGYSESDMLACLKLITESNGSIGARAASSAYEKENQIHVPPSTIQSRYRNLSSNLQLPDDPYVPVHGSPILSQAERRDFHDWVLAHARAHICLTPELLNAKVMQLASLNGRTLSKPPGRHFWRGFFRQVVHFVRSVFVLLVFVFF